MLAPAQNSLNMRPGGLPIGGGPIDLPRPVGAPAQPTPGSPGAVAPPTMGAPALPGQAVQPVGAVNNLAPRTSGATPGQVQQPVNPAMPGAMPNNPALPQQSPAVNYLRQRLGMMG
jgi:hypothetical protein